MPKINDVGYSEITPYKQEKLRALLALELKIITTPIKKMGADKCFYYFDLNAGPGKYENGMFGSPLIFLQTIKQSKFNWPYYAVFIEKNEINFKKLLSNIYDFFDGNIPNNVILRHGDNKDILPEYFFKSRQFKMGICYTDPNGLFDDELLAQFAKNHCYQRMDIIINCNSNAIKRNRIVWGKKSLVDRLHDIPKKHWVISKTFNKWQFSMLIGSNWINFPVMKKYGFIDIKTNEGKFLMEELDLTSEEFKKKHQLSLYPTDHIKNILSIQSF